MKVFLRIDDGDRTLWAHRGGNLPLALEDGPSRQVGHEDGRLLALCDDVYAARG